MNANSIDSLAITPPLPTTHPIYLRRLMRVLNATPGGFFLMQPDGSNLRCARAIAFRLGVIYLEMADGSPRYVPACKSRDFCDVSGRNVYASRK